MTLLPEGSIKIIFCIVKWGGSNTTLHAEEESSVSSPSESNAEI